MQQALDLLQTFGLLGLTYRFEVPVQVFGRYRVVLKLQGMLYGLGLFSQRFGPGYQFPLILFGCFFLDFYGYSCLLNALRILVFGP